jgi:hypothetical protein
MRDVREELRDAARRLRWSEALGVEVNGDKDAPNFHLLWPVSTEPLAKMFDHLAEHFDRYAEEGLYPQDAVEFAVSLVKAEEEARQSMASKGF